MPLSTWAIRNPIPPILLFLLLTLAGIMAFLKLPITNMPNVVIPAVTVMITQPGASATEIETQITRKVESALAGIQGVKHIQSTLSAGTSLSIIEFQLETNFDRAIEDTRDAISSIRDQLPKTIQEPMIKRIQMDGGPILIYSVEAPEMRPEALSWLIDDTVSRELLTIQGVAKVQRNGGAEHEITLTLDPIKLASYGVSAAQISRQLAQTNIDLPSGKIVFSDIEYAIRTIGNVNDLSLLKQIQIPIGHNRYVKLDDLGTFTDGAASPTSLSKLDGKPAVTFEIYRSKNASEVSVANLVDTKIAEIKKNYPDLIFKNIFSLVKFTETSFKSTLYTFIEGAILTILVVLYFLRDGRATLLAAITIPLSIMPTFLCLYWLGFSLNAVSLLAISLVTGVLVDDAIVEIENIHRHMREGKNPFNAAIIASDEIGLAVVATTLVICAVFIPVSFMGGIIGQYFKQFGLTVAIAAFFSLLVARLLTPMLAAYLLHPPTYNENKTNFWLEHYTALINWTLKNRFKTMGLALISMILSFSMLPFLKTGFIPYEDYSESRLTIELPKGATLEQTDIQAQHVTSILKQQPEVEYVLTNIYEGMHQGINQATLQIKLVPPKKRKLTQREFEHKILPALTNLPDVRIGFSNAAGMKDISIVLVSNNSEILDKTAKVIELEMRNMPELSSIGTSSNNTQPEIIIVPDFIKAAQLGISIPAISDAISISTLGDIEANLAKFNSGEKQIPIRVRFPKGSYNNLAAIENIMLETAKGDVVPLAAVASIQYGQGPSTIERYDRHRKITLEANLNGGALGEALNKIYQLPSMQNLPKGVKVENTGEAEVMGSLFKEFLQALGTGLLFVYAVQVLLYKNWIQPLTRMAALPLSIGGTFLILLLTGTELSMPVIIGILMLMGIADKNSILLVDYIIELINRGIPRQEAIIQACQIRARPIIMTSFAMLAGMMPIALGLGLDTAFRAPMAIAVIGGLISSTLLSLIFVPVLFSYVRDFEERFIVKLKRII